MLQRDRRQQSLIKLLQDSQGLTLGVLAVLLRVSERTVFRDISDLIAAGIPLLHARGGYRLEIGHLVGPIWLTQSEVRALARRARPASLSGDTETAAQLDAIVNKLRAVVPDLQKNQAAGGSDDHLNIPRVLTAHDRISRVRLASS